MKLSATIDTSRLNKAIKDYQRIGGKTLEEALAKHGGEMAYNLANALRELAPAKGRVRQERLAALAGGGGIHIRPRVRSSVMAKYGVAHRISDRKLGIGRKATLSLRRGGKNLNLQALMVSRELALRESGRGFLASSSRYPFRLPLGKLSAKSRLGPVESVEAFEMKAGTGKVEFTWGGGSELSASAAAGLSKPRAHSAVESALQKTTQNILVYIDRKVSGDIGKAGLK